MLNLVKIILILIISSSFAWSQTQLDALFVLYDAGETNGLSHLMQEYRKQHKTFKVIVAGTSRDLLGDFPERVDINDYLPGLDVGRNNWQRLQAAPVEHLLKLRADFAPKVVISGLVSELQRQILNLFYQHSYVIGFYDSFEYARKQHVVDRFNDVVHKLWTPSFYVNESLQALGFKDIETVGSAVLNEWLIHDEDSLLEVRRKKLTIDPLKKVILYTGGYGPNYKAGLDYFMSSICKRDDLHIIISLHPKSEGEIEREVISQYSNVNVTIAPKTISTREISMVVDYVVTQNSTVGVLALLQGKSVIYFNKTADYKNFAINQHLVSQFTFENDLNLYLDEGLMNVTTVTYEQLGSVENSIQKMWESIKKNQ